MSSEELIALARLCESYETELAFFQGLQDTGLIEIHIIEEQPYVHEEQVAGIEKMLRLHRELDINAAGIGAVLQLLDRVDQLQKELRSLQHRLSLYEE